MRAERVSDAPRTPYGGLGKTRLGRPRRGEVGANSLVRSRSGGEHADAEAPLCRSCQAADRVGVRVRVGGWSSSTGRGGNRRMSRALRGCSFVVTRSSGWERRLPAVQGEIVEEGKRSGRLGVSSADGHPGAGRATQLPCSVASLWRCDEQLRECAAAVTATSGATATAQRPGSAGRRLRGEATREPGRPARLRGREHARSRPSAQAEPRPGDGPRLRMRATLRNFGPTAVRRSG